MPETLTRSDIARALEVDPTTVDRWVDAGCPAEKAGKGRTSSYSLAAVVRWLREHEAAKAAARTSRGADGSDLDALKAQRLEIANERAALELAARKGELVSADEIARAMEGIVIGGRAHVLQVAPARIAARIQEPGANVAEIAQQEIHAALEIWHDATIVAAIEEAGGAVTPVWKSVPCPTCAWLREQGFANFDEVEAAHAA